MTSHLPLNALRAFEVAARTGSFSNAAREMGVSSAAISQQVKLLEEFWGKTLFIRQGNRISLTEAGQSAYPQLGQSMERLSELSDKMRRVDQKKRLVLSAPESVVETWLAPKLAVIRATSLSTSLEIKVENDPVDFARDKIDLRIFYGHDLYSDQKITPLFSDHLIAVASLAFITEHGDRLDLIRDNHLIHTDWGRDFATSPNWSAAFAADRIIDRNAGLRVQASSAARKFAEQGFGVALIPERMVRESLQSKLLVKLQMPAIPMKHDYLIAHSKRLEGNHAVQTIIQALKG
ncbi:MAG: LysR substrate-binding domain-containing protein [Paracoccaceae bacterium]|nr:LysR substrate-binding domain-containing protein [Paracoccaceae bacterium]MDG1738535.1 LysR substrate-binding domain-containing protein [Paracoccaceae bacterium]MDG2260211.1 LysR substrate-binding domain-containing protein [Paracoccaceae bacterium]